MICQWDDTAGTYDGSMGGTPRRDHIQTENILQPPQVAVGRSHYSVVQIFCIFCLQGPHLWGVPSCGGNIGTALCLCLLMVLTGGKTMRGVMKE